MAKRYFIQFKVRKWNRLAFDFIPWSERELYKVGFWHFFYDGDWRCLWLGCFAITYTNSPHAWDDDK